MENECDRLCIVYNAIFDLLELLEATDILRAHAAPARRHLVGRLESLLFLLKDLAAAHAEDDEVPRSPRSTAIRELHKEKI
jgi:hypothetical protein